MTTHSQNGRFLNDSFGNAMKIKRFRKIPFSNAPNSLVESYTYIPEFLFRVPCTISLSTIPEPAQSQLPLYIYSPYIFIIYIKYLGCV